MKSGQEFIHWLELGAGARWLRRAAVLMGALVLTLTISWRQFHGPQDEMTLLQADVARQLVSSHSFTTLVNYPQTYAVLKERGAPFDEKKPYPELHQAPLYSLLIAGAMGVIPTNWRDGLFAHRPQPPEGWALDYLLLGLNLMLFWTAVFLAWRMARRLFDDRVAWITVLGIAVSVTLWQRTVAVDGMPLLMVLVLAVFDGLVSIDELLEDETLERFSLPLGWRVVLLGLWCGLLFLTEYSAGLVAVVVGGWLTWRIRGAARWPAVGLFAAAAILLTTPWLVRNGNLTGSPVGLAWQNLALKAGDSTAEPAAQRNLATSDSPSLDFKKLGNKGLTGLERNLKERLWSGGALVFTAFFAAGLAYEFRHAPANRIRWCFAGLLFVLFVVQPFLNSGESLRLPAHYLAPLIILFGAAFFLVLVDSQPALGLHWRWIAAGVLILQGLPLVRDAMEPRKVHFFYPPYFPSLFMELRKDAEKRFLPGTGLAADVPAGAAWYGRVRTWAKPERLRDFQMIFVEQNIGALLLTPVTLDRPFFTELAARNEDTIRISDAGGWGGVYAGLVTRRMPANFPLNLPPQKLTDNIVLLLNPGALQLRGN
ncbi:MAG: hypothetical protein PHQ04_08200 [Opitutaceae bacterium]|nr:hypothetical protein [Opitutaceae bacterium]